MSIPKWEISKHDDNDDVVIRDEKGNIIANLSVDAYREPGVSIETHQNHIYERAVFITAALESFAFLKGVVSGRLNEDYIQKARDFVAAVETKLAEGLKEAYEKRVGEEEAPCDKDPDGVHFVGCGCDDKKDW